MDSILWINLFFENNFYLNVILSVFGNYGILYGLEKYKYGNGSLILL